MQKLKSSPTAKILVIIALFISTAFNNLFAQTITGSILDTDTKEAIIFANIAVHDAASQQLITGATSDMEGKFEVKIDKGVYQLKISVIGYKTLTTEGISIDSKKHDMGELLLSPNLETLSEVVVTAERSFIENKPGMQILNVGKEISTGGGTITNVLKLVPAIEVTPKGDLSIRGNSNVRILINGKEPAYGMSAETLLKQLPASTIEKIEIITNPSARDDASSSGGTINIILKKNTMDGLNVAVNLEAGGTPFRGNAGLTLNYAKGKTNTYLTYGYYKESYKFNNIENTNYSYPNSEPQSLALDGEGSFKDNGHLVLGGFDYYINDKNRFNAELMYNFYKDDWQYTTDNRFRFLQSNTSFDQKVKNNSLDKIDFTSIGLKYDFNDKEKHELMISGNYSTGGIKDKRFISSTIVNIPQADTTNINGNGRFNTVELDAEYTFDITENGTIEAGLNNDILFFETLQKTIGAGSQKYDFIQRRHAAYLIYTHSFGKFSSSIGLRPEYYNSKTTSSISEKDILQKSINLFPNVKLQYDLSDGALAQSLNLSYSKRIRRPVYDELNPVVDFSNPTHLRKGNPELKPEFIHSVELNYNISNGDSRVNTTLFGNLTNNTIQQFTELRENNVLFTTYSNHSQSKNLGLDLNTKFKLMKWWEITPAGMVILSRYANPVDTDLPFNKTGHSWNIKINNTFKYKSNTLQLQAQYYGKNKKAFYSRNAYYQVNIGYKRKVLKGLGELKLSVNDIFNSGGRELYQFEGKGFESEAEWILNSRFFSAGLSIFIK